MVRAFPTMSMVMLVPAAKAGKPKMKLPEVPSMVRVSASIA